MRHDNFCLELAQLLGEPNLIWSYRMKEGFLETVTFELRPHIFPGNWSWRKGEHERLRVPQGGNVLCEYLEIRSNGLFGEFQVLWYNWSEECTDSVRPNTSLAK